VRLGLEKQQQQQQKKRKRIQVVPDGLATSKRQTRERVNRRIDGDGSGLERREPTGGQKQEAGLLSTQELILSWP
jgi:hypothetical protein